MKIICVDDHPIMLKGLSKTIKHILPNSIIRSFLNADDALKFARDEGCDVLISEIELNGIDGLTLAQRIKKINSKVNIIFLTVCDEKEYAKEVIHIKPSGYLVKPATTEQLEIELNNLRYSS